MKEKQGRNAIRQANSALPPRSSSDESIRFMLSGETIRRRDLSESTLGDDQLITCSQPIRRRDFPLSKLDFS
jgi:hypothetical protein